MTIKSEKQRRVQELPRNVEQLVLECFEEEQYETGLNTLAEVMSPGIVPSKELLQQLVVISICKPDYRTLHRERSNMRPKKRTRLDHRRLPSGMRYHDVENARSLLLARLERPEVAERFLSMLPQGMSHKSRHATTNQQLRASSTDSSSSDRIGERGQLAMAAAWIFDDQHRNIFELFTELANSGKGSGSTRVKREGTSRDTERQWLILPPTHSKTGSRASTSRNKSKSSSSKDDAGNAEMSTTISPVHILRDEIANLSNIDTHTYEDLVAMSRREAKFDHPSVWKLLSLINAAWRTTGHTHLVNQLRPRNADPKRAISEIGDILDTIFAALSILSRFDSQRVTVPRVDEESETHFARQVTLDTLTQLANLIDDKIVDKGAMIRGILDRLPLLPISSIVMLRTTSHSSSLAEVLSKSFTSYLDTLPLQYDPDDTTPNLSLGMILQETSQDLSLLSTCKSTELSPKVKKKVEKACNEIWQLYTVLRTIEIVSLTSYFRSVNSIVKEDSHWKSVMQFVSKVYGSSSETDQQVEAAGTESELSSVDSEVDDDDASQSESDITPPQVRLRQPQNNVKRSASPVKSRKTKVDDKQNDNAVDQEANKLVKWLENRSSQLLEAIQGHVLAYSHCVRS
ncbi:unnamed protein product [Sympodiomycopsis kandeliae]